jgi:hypothetical protein
MQSRHENGVSEQGGGKIKISASVRLGKFVPRRVSAQRPQ